MRFLAKVPGFLVLEEGLRYRPQGDNRRLRALLAHEQRGYCAYSERLLQHDHTVAVEHFDDRLKHDQDDYYNYYTVLQSVNQRKRRRQRAHDDAAFMASRWFQVAGAVQERITYVVEEHVFEERDLADTDAAALIDLLGVNDEALVVARRRHAERIGGLLRDLGRTTPEERHAYFAERPEELDFLTALEHTLDLELLPLVEAQLKISESGP